MSTVFYHIAVSGLQFETRIERTMFCHKLPHVFYMQALGFVALFKGFLGHLVSVEFVSQKNHDLMKVYNIDGVIK